MKVAHFPTVPDDTGTRIAFDRSRSVGGRAGDPSHGSNLWTFQGVCEILSLFYRRELAQSSIPQTKQNACDTWWYVFSVEDTEAAGEHLEEYQSYFHGCHHHTVRNQHTCLLSSQKWLRDDDCYRRCRRCRQIRTDLFSRPDGVRLHCDEDSARPKPICWRSFPW